MVVSTWIVLRIILFIIGFILLILIFQFFVSIHPPRYYDKSKPSDYGLEYENVSFTTSDKITIRG